MYLRIVLSAMVLCAITMAQARQIVLVVRSIPADTPNDPLYIAANINNWDPLNKDFRLTKTPNGHVLEVKTVEEYLQFKVTRGSWETVEGDEMGQRIDNRLIKLSDVGDSIFITVRGWEDIKPRGTVKLQVVDETYGSMHNDQLFVTGNFNGWNPGEETYQLELKGERTFSVSIPYSGEILEYKYTRGSWNTVEGNHVGDIRGNRILIPPYLEVQHDTISTWEDLGTNKRYLMVIDQIPENTPKDAKIYVTGNFNDWQPEDENYLILRKNGKYQVSINSELDTIVYKFTRGDFSTVEGRFNGLARPNRVTIFKETDFPVHVSIMTWEDLSGEWFNVYTISLIVPVLIGFLMILALGGLENSQPANVQLRTLLIILCLALTLRVLPYYRELFTAFPQLILFADLVYFLYPVATYLYMLKLFGKLDEVRKLRYYLHFLPFAIHVVVYMPFFLIERQVFIDHIVNLDFHWVFRLVGFMGLLAGIIYWVKCILAQKAYLRELDENISFDLNLNYTRSIILLNGVALFFWLSIFIIGTIGEMIGRELIPVAEAMTDITWFIFSFNIYLFGYFAIQKPELFKIENPKPSTHGHHNSLEAEELAPLKLKLDELMKTNKPYLDDQLSLNQLADQMGTTVHTLSKVINEGFEINFYEFINQYRIEEFIRLASDPANRHKTYLRLAIEVGFNSKSTFNRSFKKIKGATPREYFKGAQPGVFSS